MLSGKYPDRVGVPGVIRQDLNDSWGYLSESVQLLPNLLKKKGYQTGMIGKWHLGYNAPNLPNDKGFDFFKGFLGDMMDDYFTHRRDGVNWMRFNQSEIDPVGHATDVFTTWALDYLNNQKNNPTPFFLYLAYNAPHFPIQPPNDKLIDVIKNHPGVDEKRAKNIALVQHLDESIGNIYKTLEKNGQLENTIIIFTSDNGGSLAHAQSNGLLNGGKQDMLEGGIKVPLIIYGEKYFKRKVISNTVGMTMDIFPTVCELTGISIPNDLDGISLLPFIQEDTFKNNRSLIWMRKEGGKYHGDTYYALREGDYKILQNSPDEPFVMYNLKNDPFEKNAIDTSHPAYAILRKKIQDYIAQRKQAYNVIEHNGIVRGDSNLKLLSLVFTGDEFFEGIGSIASTLSNAKIKGSFFLTGRLYRNKEAQNAILRLKNDGHYMGPHSDMHLLYNDWRLRDSLLVSKDSMLQDLNNNYKAMASLGIQEQKKYFIPPFEWWNSQIASWCKENFTPGTGTNADYTFPQMGNSYKSSNELLERLYKFERLHGLNGAMILIHIGTDLRRTDKFYDQLPTIINDLKAKGYSFIKVDELLK
jgi:arylsulfatase A-like enzyme/peptidoglycan/xylan/chitin deacetylase (PgdA/CDA1 family)